MPAPGVQIREWGAQRAGAAGARGCSGFHSSRNCQPLSQSGGPISHSQAVLLGNDLFPLLLICIL